MLRLENVSKKYRDFLAVNNLTLDLPAGDFFGFLGPNGAGKTTTIKIIAGLLAPTSGKVFIADIDIQKYPVDAKRLIGYIPDQPYLYDRLTGKEFLQFSGGLYKLTGSPLKAKIDEVVDLLKIEEWLNRRTEEYSQGMKQRIVIASALLHEPKLLVVDEPMVGLDPQSAAIVKNVFRQKSAAGTTILMSTHSLNVAEDICRSVGIIKNGALLFHDTLASWRSFREREYENLEAFFIELVK